MSDNQQTALEQKALAIRKEAECYAITDAKIYESAAEFLKRVKGAIRDADEFFDGNIRQAHSLHKALVAQKKTITDKLAAAEYHVKRQMSAWVEEQERVRREKQARLEADLRAQEDERRLNEAVALEKSGQKEAAQAVIEAPTEVPAVIVPSEAPRVEGIKYRDVWKYTVQDETRVPREYLMLDEKKIGALVRALKGETRIPGINVYSEKTVAA